MAIHWRPRKLWTNHRGAWYTMTLADGTLRQQVAEGSHAPSTLSSSPSNKGRKQLRKLYFFSCSLCSRAGKMGGGGWKPTVVAWPGHPLSVMGFLFVLSLLGFLKKSEYVCVSDANFHSLVFSLNLMCLHSYAFGEFWYSRAPKHLDQTKKTQTQTMAQSQQSVCQCSSPLSPAAQSFTLKHEPKTYGQLNI